MFASKLVNNSDLIETRQSLKEPGYATSVANMLKRNSHDEIVILFFFVFLAASGLAITFGWLLFLIYHF